MTDFVSMFAFAREYYKNDNQVKSDASTLESIVNNVVNEVTGNSVIYYPCRKKDKNYSENSSCSIG